MLKILIGETVSDFGSAIGDLALPLLAAITLDATAGQMASLLTAEYVPRIVVGIAAAGWMDRFRRRPVLIASNLARCAILVGVALAGWWHALTVEHLYAVAVALAGLDMLFTSTFAAYLPTLVPTAMLVAAVSFLGSVGGLALVRTPEPRADSLSTHAQPLGAIAEGWQIVLKQPILRAFAATAFTANLFYRVIMSVYVLYLTRDLGMSAATVGAIFGLGGGLGVLIGSMFAAPVARALGVGRSMIAAHVLFGLLGVPLAMTTLLPGYAAPLVFASEFLQLGVNSIYMVNRTSVEQALSPPELRGRIQSSRNVAHAAAGVLGLAAGGLLGTTLSPAAAVVVGVIGGLTSFAWLLPSPLRKLRDLQGL